MTTPPAEFADVVVNCKANVYFDGKVVSHSIRLADGSRKSLGLIYPGRFTFNTAAAEVMAITAGTTRAKLAGETAWRDYPAGTAFSVAANSSFEIEVIANVAEYVCSFAE